MMNADNFKGDAASRRDSPKLDNSSHDATQQQLLLGLGINSNNTITLRDQQSIEAKLRARSTHMRTESKALELMPENQAVAGNILRDEKVQIKVRPKLTVNKLNQAFKGKDKYF